MSSFGGTIKLTGESEYRKSLKEINSNLKVLGSEMKVVSSSYDKNDNSVEKMNATNKVATKQIEEQEKKINVLKQALENSKEKTGESSEATKRWQVQLNNAQADLNKMKNLVDDYGESTEEAGEKSLKLGDIIKANLISDAIKSGLTALANGVAKIGSAMTSAISSGAEYADNILTLSTQTGLSTDSLEKYNAVAELTDVSMDTLTSSMAKNIKSMSSGKDAYDKLGISVRDANGNLRDSEEVYWETIDALGKMENDTERDAMAMSIFGKSAQDLNTIIAMGSQGVKEYTDKAEQMGIVLGEQGLKALGELDDQFQIFKSTIGGTGNILASAFAPALTEVMEGVNELSGSFNGLISAIISGDSGAVDKAMENIGDNVKGLVDNISTMLPKILNVAEQLLKNVVLVIKANLPMIVNSAMSIISSLISGILENLPMIVETGLQILMALVNTIIENLPTIIEAGIQMLVSLINGIAESLPEIIPVIIDAVILMVETILDNIDLIIDAGINMILALADGLMNALPRLIDNIPVIIEKLITAITTNLPKIIEMGIQLTIKLAVGLIKAIPQLVAKIPQIIVAIVKGLGEGVKSMANVGLDLVKGLWQGISNATDWILGKIKGFANSVVSGIKSFFGIKSPSRVFRDEVGIYLAQGLGVGFTDEMGKITDEMQGSIPTEFDTSVNAKINGNVVSTQDKMVYAFKVALKDVLDLNPTFNINNENHFLVDGREVAVSVNERLGVLV